MKYFSIINLSLLFLGGRTNIIIDYVGITLRQYYIIHLWVSIIVLIEAFIHIALRLEFGSFVPAQLSGIILMSLFIIIYLTFVIRGFFKTFISYISLLHLRLILSYPGRFINIIVSWMACMDYFYFLFLFLVYRYWYCYYMGYITGPKDTQMV